MRRVFRRQMRKAFAPAIPPILQEANLAFDKGEYGRAAELFERIAGGTDARGGPRAPIFYLQAGRARVLAGQTKLGMPSLQRGLELLAQRKQSSRLRDSGQRIISELNDRGLKNEAADVESLLKRLLPFVTMNGAQPAPVRRTVLPTHCPQCGAALRPEEVEWLDEVTAECAYCGSPAREEE